MLDGPKAEDKFARSTFCSGGSCVEVHRDVGDRLVRVRDSKRQGSPVLSFSTEEWRAFIAGAKEGQFDV